MSMKNLVYVYNPKYNSIKEIKAFNTLEECFNFISEQNKKYTKNVKLHNKKDSKQYIELDLY